MKQMLFGAILLLPLMARANDDTLKTLEDALWRGVVTLKVNGPQYTQFLANIRDEDGRVMFVKEKGQMMVDFQLEIQFVVNAIGEYELLAKESFDGSYDLNRQSRGQFREEVNKKRLKYQQKVQEAITRKINVQFEAEESYDRETFNAGSLRLLPSGRLDKKGAIHMAGQFTFVYEGTGEFTEMRERQPPSDNDKNKKSVGDVRKTYTLPVSFEFKTGLNREPTSGTFTVTSDVKNPFPPDEKTKGRSTYRNALNLEGSFHFTPLFAKK